MKVDDTESTAEHFRKFIADALLDAMVDAINARKIKADEAKEIARLTLELMPKGQTIENSYAAALELFATFTNLLPKLPTVVKEYKYKYKALP